MCRYSKKQHVLFEKGLKDLNNEISDLKDQHMVQLIEKDIQVADLEAQLKKQIDINYELKAQLLTQNNRSANALLNTREVAANQGQLTDAPKLVPPEQLIDLNNAPLEKLMEIPTMNELVADRIIEGRPWEVLEDLIELQGVGQMRITRFRPYVTIKPMWEDLKDTD